jgi:hypothetical protein
LPADHKAQRVAALWIDWAHPATKMPWARRRYGFDFIR